MVNVQMTLSQAFALQQQGRLAEAQRLCHQILALDPGNPDAMHVLAIVYQRAGNHQQALAHFGCALALRPKSAEFHYNRGNSLLHLRRFDEAAVSFAQAAKLDPRLFEAQLNFANALMLGGRVNEAAEGFEAALKLRPESAEAHNNLGLALKDLSRLDEAIASFRRAIEINPNYQHAHSNLLYALHFSPAYDANAIFAEHQRWAAAHCPPSPRPSPRVPGEGERRLRIGYVSPDLRDHPVGRSLLPILEHRDREHFEAICYSDSGATDPISQRLRAAASAWHDIRRLPDVALANLIREHRIDILVDLTLHMNRNRLLALARRPAPVQTTFLGYPATTGMSQIDYRITDPYLDPPGETEAVNSEKLARLKHSFWCYAPDGSEPPINEPPAVANGYVTFGSLNNPAKITPEVVALWSQLLTRVESSRLVLHVNGRDAVGGALQDAFVARGIEPSRLRFITKRPRNEYLQQYHQIDIGLDPFPYNGHMTSLDAMWMGVPVVSVRGQTSVGRGGESLLTNVNLTELLARSPDQYLDICARLACDIARLTELRPTLRRRLQNSPLLDGAGFARDVERLYREMWGSVAQL